MFYFFLYLKEFVCVLLELATVAQLHNIGRKLLTNLPESVLGTAESSRYHNFKLEMTWLFRIAYLRG